MSRTYRQPPHWAESHLADLLRDLPRWNHVQGRRLLKNALHSCRGVDGAKNGHYAATASNSAPSCQGYHDVGGMMGKRFTKRRTARMMRRRGGKDVAQRIHETWVHQQGDAEETLLDISAWGAAEEQRNWDEYNHLDFLRDDYDDFPEYNHLDFLRDDYDDFPSEYYWDMLDHNAPDELEDDGYPYDYDDFPSEYYWDMLDHNAPDELEDDGYPCLGESVADWSEVAVERIKEKNIKHTLARILRSKGYNETLRLLHEADDVVSRGADRG